MVVIRLRCSLPAYHSKPSLICDFCPSDQRFAYSFLQIPPHGRHPCCLAIHFPLPGHVRDSHPLERAHGAQTKKTDSNVCYPFLFPAHFLNNLLIIIEAVLLISFQLFDVLIASIHKHKSIAFIHSLRRT